MSQEKFTKRMPCQVGRLRELIFLGAGSSCCVPCLPCFIHPEKDPCAVCLDARDDPHSRNRRLNTSCVLRGEDGKTILIDCGRV